MGENRRTTHPCYILRVTENFDSFGYASRFLLACKSFWLLPFLSLFLSFFLCLFEMAFLEAEILREQPAHARLRELPKSFAYEVSIRILHTIASSPSILHFISWQRTQASERTESLLPTSNHPVDIRRFQQFWRLEGTASQWSFLPLPDDSVPKEFRCSEVAARETKEGDFKSPRIMNPQSTSGKRGSSREEKCEKARAEETLEERTRGKSITRLSVVN